MASVPTNTVCHSWKYIISCHKFKTSELNLTSFLYAPLDLWQMPNQHLSFVPINLNRSSSPLLVALQHTFHIQLMHIPTKPKNNVTDELQFVTARVRSTREGNVFSLSTGGGGSDLGFLPWFPVPGPFPGGVPCPGPGQWEGVPQSGPRTGPPSPPARTRTGVPPPKLGPGQGYPPQSGLGQYMVRTGYAAGGASVAVTQEDFLVSM